jgi:hypothetical protein
MSPRKSLLRGGVFALAMLCVKGGISAQSRSNQLVTLPPLEELLSNSLYESGEVMISNVSKFPRSLRQLGLAHKRIFGFRSLDASKYYQPLALICTAGDQAGFRNGTMTINGPTLDRVLQPGETARVLGLFLCLKMDFAAPTSANVILEMTDTQLGAAYYQKVLMKFGSEVGKWLSRHDGEEPSVAPMQSVFTPSAASDFMNKSTDYPVDVERIFRRDN